MEQRLSLVTLGVADLARSIAFYEGLGWQRRMKAVPGVAFFQLGAIGLSLYPMADLAGDAGVATPASGGFGGMALAHNVRSRDAVDTAMAQAVSAGARITRAARDMPWDGYCGYFADPDGHCWEIAWNPGFPIDEDGAIHIPDAI